jgi:hypothetical protein
MTKTTKKTRTTKKPDTLSVRDKYLRKTYGITEAEYKSQLQKQGGVCYICGQPPGEKSLHVDHDHAVANCKILSSRSTDGWIAWPDSREILFEERAGTKSKALTKVRARLKRLSVRGILDWSCNKALKPFRDNPDNMEMAAAYIRKYKVNLCHGRNGFEVEG